MRTAKAAWTWVIILALCVSVGWTQEPPGDIKAESQKKAVPAARQASCIVKITADPAVLPLTIDNVMYLIHSSGVGGRALAEMLGEDRPAPDEVIHVEELIGPDDDRPRGYGGGGYGGYGMGGGGGYGGYGMSYYSASGLETQDTPAGPTAALPTAAASGGTSDGRRTTRITSSTRRTTPTAARSTSSLPTTTSSSSRYSTTSRPTKAPVPAVARSRTPSTTPTRSTTSMYGRYTRQPGSARAGTATSAPRDRDQALFFQLIVDFRDYEYVSADAQAVMLTIIEYLRDALLNAFGDQGHSLESQIKLADQEVSRAEAILVALQDHLRNISGSQDLSRQVILSDIRRLRNELESAKMQQAADEATDEALARQIDRSRKKLYEKLQTDEIMQELKQIVEINKEKVAFTEVLYKKGNASLVEVSKASEESARARIELAKRAEEISKSVAGGQGDEWNNILANLSVDMAQNAARVAGLEPQLTRGEDLLAMADRYEVESLKLGLAKRNLEEAILWQSQMSRKARVLSPPTVIVIGAE